MGRSPCCSKEGLNRGAWTSNEDKTLTDYINLHGEGSWRNLPKKAGLKRCGKSCRLRWLNYLRPDIKRGDISTDEEDLIIRLHKLLGNRWSLIAGRLPGRTDNEIKNYWNTKLRRKAHQTHKHSNQLKVGDLKTIPNTASQSKVTSNETKQVVRTKAVRCSKVFIIPQLQENELNIATNTTSTIAGQLAMVNNTSIDVKQMKSSPNNHDVYLSSSLSTLEEDYDPYDFMLTFDIGEISFEDFLSSDFSGLCDFDYGYNAINDLPSFANAPPLFLKDIQEEKNGIEE